MAYVTAAILILSYLGCKLTQTQVPNAGSVALVSAFVLVALLPLPLYLREKKKLHWLDIPMTLLWAIVFSYLLFFPVTIAGRLSMAFPLQDTNFVALDRRLGVYVPAITNWISALKFGNLINLAYPALIPFMKLAVLIPALGGRVRDAQRYLVANLIAFAIGLPLFTCFPAVGPWYGYHLPARVDQAACETLVMLIRQPGPYLFQPPAGVICFPSFHVIWAILCAQAVWGFRWLRIPAAILSAAIVFSTMTTGVHYFCDVLGGLLVASISVYAANCLFSRPTREAGVRVVHSSGQVGP
jgi:membrane-associated phospholipid phosphatase